MKVIIDAELWLWDTRHADTWTFVSLPASESKEIRNLAGGLRRGLRFTADADHDRHQHVDDIHHPGQPGWLCAAGQAAGPHR